MCDCDTQPVNNKNKSKEKCIRNNNPERKIGKEKNNNLSGVLTFFCLWWFVCILWLFAFVSRGIEETSGGWVGFFCIFFFFTHSLFLSPTLTQENKSTGMAKADNTSSAQPCIYKWICFFQLIRSTVREARKMSWRGNCMVEAKGKTKKKYTKDHTCTKGIGSNVCK